MGKQCSKDSKEQAKCDIIEGEDISNEAEVECEQFNLPLKTLKSPSGRIIDLERDADDAMKLVLSDKSFEFTQEEDNRLVRKIDLIMFPLMAILYAVQFMDKVTSGNAAIMGLREDLGMKGNQYTWVGSSFYLGYLLGLFILPPLLQKTKYFMKLLCTIIILWGLILSLHSAPAINYASFIFLRCLLGFLESAITPSFTIITSQYWKREEQFLRICIWVGFNGLGGIWGNGIALGLYKHMDSYSIEPWKLIFVITGVITIFLGFLMILHLPDSPDKAWFLNKHEKRLLVERIKGNYQGFGNHHIKKYQIVEAVKDVRTWLYFLFAIASQIPNGGLSNFQTILFKEDFKFSTVQTLKIGFGTNAVELIGCPLFGWLSYRCYMKNVRLLNSRSSWAFISLCAVFMGVCMLAFANKDKNARMASLFLYNLSPVAFICMLSNISTNTLGYTKKWTVSSLFLMAYAAANIAGPHTFIAKEAPNYTSAKISLVVCYGVSLFLVLAIYFVNVRENRKRDQKSQDDMCFELEAHGVMEFSDLTDFENPKFRYSL